MRTYLFAAVVAALSTNVAAQDDNAITDMISNPILCVSAAHESSFMHFTTPSERPLWLLDGARESVVRRGPRAARSIRRRREALNMKNKNLYAGVAAGFVSGKVVKSFAYSLVPVAAVGYCLMHAPEILAKLGFEKYAVMIEEQHAKFVEAEEKFEALMKEKGKEFISGDNLKTMGKLKRKLARFAKKHVPLVGGFATGFSLAMASFP